MNGTQRDGGVGDSQTQSGLSPPAITLPKGGGAIRGMGEKFAANPVTGTGTVGLPIVTSNGRAGFGPEFSLSYDSGAGNGPFGFGWHLSLPSITRKTDKGIPQYQDTEESDVFILSDAEDMVPALKKVNGQWQRDIAPRDFDGVHYTVCRYRPRIERFFARIERWIRDDGDTHWRTISPDNVTSLFGKTSTSRIADPDDPSRVFSWLISERYDDRGNVIVYEYQREDSARIFEDLQGQSISWLHERNRTNQSRSANIYLKRVKYGNQTPNRDSNGNATDPTQLSDWMFETVFDYGEGHYEALPPNSDNQSFVTALVTAPNGSHWQVRQDPFSSYRAGFEVRTYRLCQRVLMFHHFAQELGTDDYLVRSTDFEYTESSVASFLTSFTQSGYIHQPDQAHPNRYLKQSLPKIEFEYGAVPDPTQIGQQPVQTVDPTSLENLPYGADGTTYQWVDLDGEGLAGVLTEQADGWFYKRNLSPLQEAPNGDGNGPVASFGPLELVATKLAAGLVSNRAQFMDLAGDGQMDLVQVDTPMRGFYERTEEREWAPFQPFTAWQNVDIGDPNLRMVDLNGDGHADILVTEQDAITWYPSLAEDGFGPALRIPQAIDEERGPRLIFADSDLSIHLADLSGDGLSDLVRVRNGEVCYWPNLGYGHFGSKVSMDFAPWFDTVEGFDPRRIRLTDIDGSGTTDIIYLHQSGAQIYLNQSGNHWSEAIDLPQFPAINNLSSVQVLDLLGNGTACLVWTSPLPNDSQRAMRFVDLMGNHKPHLLERYHNGMGQEVSVTYKPSTFYYLTDREAGQPWATRLPFPVQCVSQATVRDEVRETVFTDTYTYHHGYYDGIEREFRGFGRVEKLDTETYADFKRTGASNVVEEDLHQPPVLTKMWFHTGAFLTQRDQILHQYQEEYYHNYQLQEYQLPEPQLPTDMDSDEYREFFRACKGLMLRQEVYGDDGTEKAKYPYTTLQASYGMELVQPRGINRYASFLIVGGEGITYYYERNPSDPRIAHSLVLETDELGMVHKAANVVYPRRTPDASLPAEVRTAQARRYIAYTETDYTNDVEGADVHRLRVPYDIRSYELTGLATAADTFLTTDMLRQAAADAELIPFESTASTGLQKRLIDHSRTLHMKNDLSGPLSLGTLDSVGLTYQSYQLAFTSGLASQQFGANIDDSLYTQAGYVHIDGDDNWWVPSGTAMYSADAQTHFYLPSAIRDPLGSITTLDRDIHDLLTERITDALNSQVAAENDYRTLAPRQITDANLNVSAVETDALGIVVKTAVMGKANAGEGDTLDDPTTRVEYDLFQWRDHHKPTFVHTFSREQHGAANPRWQEQYLYMDGSGAPIMTKVQAEPGLAKRWNPATQQVEEVDTTPAVRWIGNGRIILNNKGAVIRQYEPYFSVTPEFETARELVETGVTPTLTYDPLGRNIRVDLPNKTFARTEFDPWGQRNFDSNDTVLESQWYADRGSPDPASQEPSDPETRSAWLAAKHANTPTVTYTDSLGRVVYGIVNNGSDGAYNTRSELDFTGHVAEVYDSRNRLVSTTIANVAGSPIYGESAERGERWTFSDVLGNPLRIWDAGGRKFRAEYDPLHRPLSAFYRHGAGPEIALDCAVYGEMHPQAKDHNLIGRPYQLYDQAGVVTLEQFDFKGNVTSIKRRFTSEYRLAVDWSSLSTLTDITAIQIEADHQLESEAFTVASSFDALNRPVQVRLPDQTVAEPRFNEGNFLDSLRAQIRGQGSFITFLVNQDYDAKGQRQFARLGNGAITRYLYDPNTFRLTNLFTKVESDPDANSLQNLTYTYDPAGNITRIADTAQQTHYFRNNVVKAESLFEYDAIYRLIRATGREHAGNGGGQPTDKDVPANPLPHSNNAAAVRRYTELYQYDDFGNILRTQHIANGGNWTRRYHYSYQDDATNRTNRLVTTSLPGDKPAGPYSATYSYDNDGNMTKMPHLQSLDWNSLDQLKTVNLGGGGTAYYVYAASGQRMRKVVERSNGLRVERLYLGAVEIYRRWGANGLRLERQTVHIADDVSRIAQIDTKTVDTGNSDTAPLGTPVVRYQYTNHLGSAVLETNDAGKPISYEEYHPYGTTAYHSSKPGSDISLKRYRYSGKERDEETGLYYVGVRYYAPWLGRWTSSDPGGFVDGLNLFRYCRNNPVMVHDSTGMGPDAGVIASTPDTERLRNKSMEAEAKTYMEGVYTSRLKLEHSSDRVVIDKMHFNAKTRTWIVDKMHLEPKASSDGGVTTTDPTDAGTTADSGTDAGTDTSMDAANEKPNTNTTEGSAKGSPKGKPGGSEKGSPEGTPGGTGDKVNKGAPAEGPKGSGSGPPRERTFWDRGGKTLLLGLGILALGLLTVATGGGALIMFSAGMAIGAGAATAIGSGVLLAASYSGHTTAEEDRKWTGALSDAALVASSPGSLIGGGVGYAVNGREGMRTGALVGGLAEGVISLGAAGIRSAGMKPGPGLTGSVGEATLQDWRMMTAQQRTMYEWGQLTVRNSVWAKMGELGIQGNPIAKGEFLFKTFGGRWGILRNAWNPFLLKTTWGTGLTAMGAYLAPSLMNGVGRVGGTTISYGVAASSN